MVTLQELPQLRLENFLTAQLFVMRFINLTLVKERGKNIFR